MSEPVTARVLDQPFVCRICSNPTFGVRYIMLNTNAAEVFNFGWANKQSTGLICVQCGYIHEFLGDAVTMYKT